MMKRQHINNYLLYSTIGVIIGYWILISIGLPLKWAFTLLAATFLGFGIWVFKDVEKVLFVLLLLAIPLNLDINFLFVEKHHAGMSGISIGLIDFFLILLFIFWIARICLIRGKEIDLYPRITIPLVALIIVASLSAIKAKDPMFSLFEIILLIKGLLIFLYLINKLKTESELKLVLMCLTAGIFIQSIFGLLQHFSGSPLGLGILGESTVFVKQELKTTVISRIGGTIGYTNDYAKYLSFFLPIILSSLFCPMRRIARTFYFLTLTTLTLATLFTLSRVAWIGIVFSTFVVFILQRRIKTIKILYPALGLLLIGLFAISQNALILQRFTSDDIGSAQSRLTTSKVAFKMIADYPLLGIGANNYQLLLPEYGDSRNPETFTMAVHNMYLLHIAEIGILGFGIFLWLNVNLLRGLWSSVHLPSIVVRSFGIGVLGAYIALFIQGFADFGVKHNEPRFVLFWVVVATTLGARKDQKSEKIALS